MVQELTCIYSTYVNIESLFCNIGPGGPTSVGGTASVGGPAPSTMANPVEEKKVKEKKKESEKADDDIGFGLFN
ncbi:unnamed protein product [Nyctereutes procyonoides]|uniref:(raccoon dog) hypothetical protein n=1 Tax=Nyctereutes procyonoides TaxID=34880 RepID=A0A811ZBU6_NYCPR|nr:unnamed protein product [Nyctereutes procyonoides]